MNNHFFTLCESSDNSDSGKAETYNCCIRTCTSGSSDPKLCYPMCAQIFPLIKDQCAFESNCWKDGVYNPQCLTSNKQQIQKCCIRECKSYRYTRFPEHLDCDAYCSDYSIIPERRTR
jgi:hypothetical protein